MTIDRRTPKPSTSPTYPGETIRTEMWRDGAFRARVVERDVAVVDHGLAVVGAVA